MKSISPVLGVVLAAAVMVGCDSGPELGQVRGTVTLDGEPVKGLEVRFEPVDPSMGTTARGYTQEDGAYELHYPGSRQGAPPGKYTVSIAGAETDGEGPPKRVPAKYNANSELTADVAAGENEIDFDLTTG